MGNRPAFVDRHDTPGPGEEGAVANDLDAMLGYLRQQQDDERSFDAASFGFHEDARSEMSPPAPTVEASTVPPDVAEEPTAPTASASDEVPSVPEAGASPAVEAAAEFWVEDQQGNRVNIEAADFRYEDHPGLLEHLQRIYGTDGAGAPARSVSEIQQDLETPQEPLTADEVAEVETTIFGMTPETWDQLSPERQQEFHNARIAFGLHLAKLERVEAEEHARSQVVAAGAGEAELSEDERHDLIAQDAAGHGALPDAEAPPSLAAAQDSEALEAAGPTAGHLHDAQPAFQSMLANDQPAPSAATLMAPAMTAAPPAPKSAGASGGTGGGKKSEEASGGPSAVLGQPVDLLRNPLINLGYTVTMALPRVVQGSFAAWRDLATAREDRRLDQKLQNFETKAAMFNSPAASEPAKAAILGEMEDGLPALRCAFEACYESARRHPDPAQRQEKLAALNGKLQSVERSVHDVIGGLGSEHATAIAEAARRLAEAITSLLQRMCSRFGIQLSGQRGPSTAGPQSAPAAAAPSPPPSFSPGMSMA